MDRGAWTVKPVKRPRQQPAHPQYANYWAPLTRKRHTIPHSAQPRHTNYWAPRTRKRHHQEHRPQRPTERSDPTQHAKGRTGDCPGPRKETTTRRNVTQGVDPVGHKRGRGDGGDTSSSRTLEEGARGSHWHHKHQSGEGGGVDTVRSPAWKEGADTVGQPGRRLVDRFPPFFSLIKTLTSNRRWLLSNSHRIPSNPRWLPFKYRPILSLNTELATGRPDVFYFI